MLHVETEDLQNAGFEEGLEPSIQDVINTIQPLVGKNSNALVID